MGPGVASGPSSSGAPAGGRPASRPSRIPQPSRLPQPLRHHPAEPEGPDKMSGTSGRYPPCALGEPDPRVEIPRMRVLDGSRGTKLAESGPKDPHADPLGPVPRAAVSPLSLSKPRAGAASPLASPMAAPAFGKDGFLPGSPQKGASFWSSVPASPASRPGSFTFPGEGDSLGRQSQRHSTHSKDADRMSTCSSASEQSVQSTQSNGVRAWAAWPGCLFSLSGTNSPPASDGFTSLTAPGGPAILKNFDMHPVNLHSALPL